MTHRLRVLRCSVHPSLAEQGCQHGLRSAVTIPEETHLGPSPHMAMEEHVILQETRPLSLPKPHTCLLRSRAVFLASSTVLTESSVNSFPVPGAQRGALGTAACRDPSWWGFHVPGEQEWAPSLSINPRATSARRTHPLQNPIGHGGLRLHTCQGWLWCYPHPTGLLSAAWCAAPCPQHAHTLLRHKHLCKCKGLILGTSAEGELEHSPCAQPQGHCTSGRESTVLDLLRNCAGFLCPHTNQLICRLILNSVLKISAPTRVVAPRLPSQPPGQAQELL